MLKCRQEVGYLLPTDQAKTFYAQGLFKMRRMNKSAVVAYGLKSVLYRWFIPSKLYIVTF